MNRKRVLPLTMTILWSIVFANVMHSWPMGICLGLCFGLIFGLLDSDQEGKDGNHAED